MSFKQYTMDETSDEVIIVAAKSKRGREMIASEVPQDIFDSMRLVTEKVLSSENVSSELQKPRKNDVDTFYEGYVDGKKYLVPDTTLEAMKDIINLNMRRKKSKRYRHQTSIEIDDASVMTQERIDQILARLENFSFSNSSEDENSLDNPLTQEEKNSNQEKYNSSKNLTCSVERNISEISKSNGPQDTLKSEESPSKSSYSSIEEVGNNKVDNISSKSEEICNNLHYTESGDSHLRVLLSGHFINEEMPLYLIQELCPESDVFQGQEKDFSSLQTQGNVDILISGKVYQENIVEEIEGKPVFLNMKPNRIPIDASKVKTFYGCFEETFDTNTVEITLKGKFVRSKSSHNITPFLSLNVRHKQLREPDTILRNNQQPDGDDVTTVLFHNSNDRALEVNKNNMKENFTDIKNEKYSKEDSSTSTF